MSKKTDSARKLRRFQSLMDTAVTNYQDQLERMPRRRMIYDGNHEIQRPVKGDGPEETDYVNNVAAELIESQVSPDVPH